MKFVHIADMHFDVPFTSLNTKGDLGDIRRIEQRKIFKKIIDYIKDNNVDYFFISGDLYEHEYIKKSTIDYINNCFKEIPDTKIFISPGNHDPYVVNSYYDSYDFSNNVYIFKGDIEKIKLDNINIYGMAFTSFYMNGIDLDTVGKLDNDNPNIFIVHCDLNGSRDENGFSYNNINEIKLKSLGFDYVAMGHIHKTNFDQNSMNKIIYPGSTIAMGFDELGSHGMIVGEIASKGEISLEFVKLDEREFIVKDLNVEGFNSQEELILNIQELDLNKNNLYKINLVGKRNFEIDSARILKLLNKENIIKVKDFTKINYNLEKLSKENNLRGFFVKEALKKLNSGEATEEEIEKAIEIGLDVM